MIHDLTANGDFTDNRSWWQITNSQPTAGNSDDLILTGDYSDRRSKRIVAQCKEEFTVCDCCGAPLSHKPWSFEQPQPLCPHCQAITTHFEELDYADLSQVVLQTHEELIVRHNKPWDATEDREPRQRYTDNVLLWD